MERWAGLVFEEGLMDTGYHRVESWLVTNRPGGNLFVPRFLAR